jgi:hypothetical protein
MEPEDKLEFGKSSGERFLELTDERK